MELPEDVTEALNLLRDSEQAQDHEQRAELLGEALELIEDHLAHTPASIHATRLHNAKLAHTRRLLAHLLAAGHLELFEWFQYWIILATKLKAETEQVLEQDPSLRAEFDRFGVSHREEMEEILRPFTSSS